MPICCFLTLPQSEISRLKSKCLQAKNFGTTQSTATTVCLEITKERLKENRNRLKPHQQKGQGW